MAKDSKEKLIKVATKIFAEKGYEAASTRDICSLAGANISAIAYYFKNKHGLYQEILCRIVKEINQYFIDDVKEYEKQKVSLKNPELSKTYLKNFIHKFMRVICLPQLPKDMAYIYLYEYINPSDSFHIFGEGLNDVYMPIVQNLILDANNGKMSEEDASLTTIMLFSQIFNAVIRKESILKYMHWKQYSESEIEKICEIIDRGLFI